MGAQKGADEIYCRSCGEVIKKEAEICPNCGVRNGKSTSKNSAHDSKSRAQTSSQSETSSSTSSTKPSTAHDPTKYETTVSDTWWYGVAGGTALWILVMALVGAGGDSFGAFAGFLILFAWIGLPIAAYFDMQYIRANGNWNPNTILWVVLLSIWFVNIIGGVVYLYRRHEVLDVP